MLSEKDIKEFQKVYKKVYGKEISYKAAEESAHNLLGFFQTLIKVDTNIKSKQIRLKKEPNGFPIEEGVTYNCLICHSPITSKNGWWDKYGPKCLTCQRAIDTKVIPGYICKNRDSWYAMWELKDRFGIHPATARKMIKEGKLKARIIKGEKRGVHEYIFIIKENKNIFI